jgi:hypothetical protein
MLLSNYSAVTVSDLIADINAANSAGGTNTITLTAPTSSPYVLTAVNNSTDGPTGLPVIAGGNAKQADTLTIVGNGDIIERSTASGTPDFRLFDVANGGSLTLENLTLENGLEVGSGSSAEGGAIYNQGSLILSNLGGNVTVQDNIAQGSAGTVQRGKSTPGNDAQGGGIWSNGSLTADNGSLIQNNQAIGGQGVFGFRSEGGGRSAAASPGGNGLGGGLYVSGGTATLTGATVNNNTAQGGEVGGSLFAATTGGNGCGGGVYVAGGTVTLSSDTVDGNQAVGGAEAATENNGFSGGNAYGGAVYVAGGSATLSSDTVDGNQAVGGAVLVGLPGSKSGNAYGGGLYVADGTVTLSSDTVQSNAATGGAALNGIPGQGYGGGLYNAAKAKNVSIDSATLITNNTANTDPNIDGPFTSI